ncbi:MAG: entericidin A/B family lipoprotein [Burkholderiaceae bacterium]|nr:entericidin A/B family lipoprotein [Burkholderiaceae bacterium]MCD6674032.1 entericidin A/B family lipoprotein [Burkholderiaceae bacterium]
MNRALIVVAAVFCGVVLSACNTMAGMGKDIQRAGESIQGAARR